MHASDPGITARVGSEPFAYTLQEVADVLSLSYRKVRYMVDSGELEVIRIGRARRVLRTTLQRYVDDLQKAS